jgi:hypothetical protein
MRRRRASPSAALTAEFDADTDATLARLVVGGLEIDQRDDATPVLLDALDRLPLETAQLMRADLCRQRRSCVARLELVASAGR